MRGNNDVNPLCTHIGFKFYNNAISVKWLMIYEHLLECYSISVPADKVNICQHAVPPSFYLPEQRFGAFRLHYTLLK